VTRGTRAGAAYHLRLLGQPLGIHHRTRRWFTTSLRAGPGPREATPAAPGSAGRPSRPAPRRLRRHRGSAARNAPPSTIVSFIWDARPRDRRSGGAPRDAFEQSRRAGSRFGAPRTRDELAMSANPALDKTQQIVGHTSARPDRQQLSRRGRAIPDHSHRFTARVLEPGRLKMGFSVTSRPFSQADACEVAPWPRWPGPPPAGSWQAAGPASR